MNHRSITFLILASACANAQQHPNFLYSVYPSTQYRANQQDSHLNHYRINHLMKPPTYNIGYYATPAQLPSTISLPNRYLIHGRPEYLTSAFEQSNQQYPQQAQQHLNYQQRYQIDQQRRSAPQIVQQQRNEGNFYRKLSDMQNSNATTAQRKKHDPEHHHHHQHYENQQDLKHHQQMSKYTDQNAGYAAFEHKVLHVTTPMTLVHHQDYRKRRSFSPKKLSNETTHIQTESKNANLSTKLFGESLNAPKSEQQRFFHDIFMHYAGPQSIAFGHVDRQPLHFTQRFESLNKGNRYRGEVTWADAKTGGFGSQHWDLVQGKL